MPINCFRAARRDSDIHDNEPVRQVYTQKSPKMSTIRRTFTGSASMASSQSSSRSSSNASIALLPPCPHVHDPQIDALMMPVPAIERPSKCLRLSFPRIYSNIVSDMRDVKGCRDWRNFAVFEDDDVDMSVSAVEYARRKAEDYEKKLSILASF